MIESVAIDERDVNSAESLQEKISKGIRDIFSGNKKKETEEDFMKEEQGSSGRSPGRNLSKTFLLMRLM